MLNRQIIDEASEWFVTLRYEEGAEGQEQEKFMAWLRTSPEHVRAYLDIMALWTDIPAVDAGGNFSERNLIARAREADNVIALPPKTGSPSARAAGLSGLRRPMLAAASVAVLAIGSVAALWLWHARAPTFITAVGEQRSLKLDDGSTVELNSRSRIEVRFSSTARDIELLDGQALFHVAKDPARPFRVMSDDTQVRAVGTQFDVYKKKDGVIVTVLEGRVAVPSAADTIYLSAGEQLTVRPKVKPRPIRTNVAAATAWSQGQLMFRSTPLSSVVEEFNRYNPRQIVLGPEVDDFPITAVFASTDPQSLIGFLRDQPGILVQDGGEGIRIGVVPARP